MSKFGALDDRRISAYTLHLCQLQGYFCGLKLKDMAHHLEAEPMHEVIWNNNYQTAKHSYLYWERFFNKDDE